MSIEILNGLNQSMNDNSLDNIKLSIIIRKTRQGEKVFETKKIDWNAGLKTHYKSSIKKVLSDAIASSVVKEYQVVVDNVDEGNSIYSYPLNAAQKFSKVVSDDLPNRESLEYVTSLGEIRNRIWGYAISYHNPNNDSNAFFIRKLTKTKIYTDTSDGGVFKKIRCVFDTTDSKLSPIDDSVIEFDNKIDCVFYNNKYYILNKNHFENLVDIEEEYRKVAKEIITALESTSIKGLDIVEELVFRDKKHLKRIQSIAEKNDFNIIDMPRLERMKEISEQFDLELKIENDEIVIEDSEGAEILLKFLDKYYVKCMQTDEAFGANAKIPL